MERMGLINVNADIAGTSLETVLDKACRLELFLVFMGIYSEWAVPFVLMENSLMDDDLADEIWDAPEAEAWRMLKAAVTWAYFSVCGRVRALN